MTQKKKSTRRIKDDNFYASEMTTEKLEPLKGHITPVRTVQETRPTFEFGAQSTTLHIPLGTNIERTGEAYVAQIATRSASQVIKYVDNSRLHCQRKREFF